jgi:hypothetical protein
MYHVLSFPKEKRTKMEPTTEKGLLVGYSETFKAYRLYIPALRRVVVRRDVNFKEERACRRSRELEERQPSTSQQQGSQVKGVGMLALCKLRFGQETNDRGNLQTNFEVRN